MVQAFLLKHWKFAAIGILLVLLWVMYQWGDSQRIQKEENAKGMDAALSLVDKKEAEVTEYKNKLGDAVIVIQNQELDRKNFDKIAKLERFNLEKAFNVKLKKVESLTTFNTTSKVDSVMDDPVHSTVHPKDTTLRLFEYKDKHNDLRFYVNDSSRFKQTDVITGIDIRSRPDKWFWKMITFRKWKETSTYQLTHENKLIEINSVLKMQVARKR